MGILNDTFQRMQELKIASENGTNSDEEMNYVKASLKEQVSMPMLVHAKVSSMNVLELLK